jgi:hypothetical protein
MSILEKDPSLDKSFDVARSLKIKAYEIFKYLVNEFNLSSQELWSNPQGVDSQEIINALGKDAVELFDLHRKLGSLIASIDVKKIEYGLSIIKPTVIEDNFIKIVK